MVDLNEYFNKNDTKAKIDLLEIKKDKIFCTKYSKDKNWYRVRILRTPSDKNVIF